jgi:hypothetical protein
VKKPNVDGKAKKIPRAVGAIAGIGKGGNFHPRLALCQVAITNQMIDHLSQRLGFGISV